MRITTAESDAGIGVLVQFTNHWVASFCPAGGAACYEVETPGWYLNTDFRDIRIEAHRGGFALLVTWASSGEVMLFNCSAADLQCGEPLRIYP